MIEKSIDKSDADVFSVEFYGCVSSIVSQAATADKMLKFWEVFFLRDKNRCELERRENFILMKFLFG